jgi:hypothetical protein
MQAMQEITKAQQALWFDQNTGSYLHTAEYPRPQNVCLHELARGDWAADTGIEYALCLCCHITQKQAGFVWAKIEQIILGKGDDYAGDNRFSAFVFAAKFAGIKEPETVIRAQIAIKIHRLQNLLSSGNAAKYESVADNAYDLLGYTILLAQIRW